MFLFIHDSVSEVKKHATEPYKKVLEFPETFSVRYAGARYGRADDQPSNTGITK
jgi:hypothetical protein